MIFWYSYDPEDGYTSHDSADEAREAAEASLEYHRERSSDGWNANTSDIAWGMLLPFAEARQVNVVETPEGEHDYTCDYELCAVHDAQNTALVELGQACTKAIEERNEARAKLAEALDCGQEGVCVLSPGCCRHWEERNQELVNERNEARELLAKVFDRYACTMCSHGKTKLDCPCGFHAAGKFLDRTEDK